MPNVKRRVFLVRFRTKSLWQGGTISWRLPCWLMCLSLENTDNIIDASVINPMRQLQRVSGQFEWFNGGSINCSRYQIIGASLSIFDVLSLYCSWLMCQSCHVAAQVEAQDASLRSPCNKTAVTFGQANGQKSLEFWMFWFDSWVKVMSTCLSAPLCWLYASSSVQVE